jgi:hypothetical protein
MNTGENEDKVFTPLDCLTPAMYLEEKENEKC